MTNSASPNISQQSPTDYANELLGGGLDVLTRHKDESGSYIGPGMLQILIDGLCEGGYSGGPKEYANTDLSFGILGDRYTVSQLVKHVLFLVQYLEEGKAARPIEEFIETIRKIPEWSFSESEEFHGVWNTLWNAIMFAGHIPILSDSFKGQIENMFDCRPKARKGASKTFTISLANLEAVELQAIPTRTINEHLALEGSQLKVLDLTNHRWNLMEGYHKNRAAKKLGIESLGNEVLSSLYAMYGKDELFRKAETMGLFCPGSDIQRIALQELLRRRGSQSVTPNVLAARLRILENAIQKRCSWRTSIKRDIKKQWENQPFILYGAFLAIFFGICSVIQTVASVWALKGVSDC